VCAGTQGMGNTAAFAGDNEIERIEPTDPQIKKELRKKRRKSQTVHDKNENDII